MTQLTPATSTPATSTTVLYGPSPIIGGGPSSSQRGLDNFVWAWLALVIVVTAVVVAVWSRRSASVPSSAPDGHR